MMPLRLLAFLSLYQTVQPTRFPVLFLSSLGIRCLSNASAFSGFEPGSDRVRPRWCSAQ